MSRKKYALLYIGSCTATAGCVVFKYALCKDTLEWQGTFGVLSVLLLISAVYFGFMLVFTCLTTD